MPYQFFWSAIDTLQQLKIGLEVSKLSGKLLKKFRWGSNGKTKFRHFCPQLLDVKASWLLYFGPRLGSSFYPTVTLAYFDQILLEKSWVKASV